MLPLLQNSLINEKAWLTEDEFMDVVSVCQSLPGVVAINMATYVGYKRAGVLGSLVSTIAVILPSFIIIIAIATGLSFASDNRYVQGAMQGFRAAALGMVIVSVIQLSASVFKKWWIVLEAFIALILIVLFKVSTAVVVLIFALLGILANVIKAGRSC